MTQPKTKCTFDALLHFVRFSHDATKTLIFDAALSGKAGFLMTRQKRCKSVALLRDKAGFLRTH